MGFNVIKFGTLDLTDASESWEQSLETRLNAMQVPKRHGVLISEAPVTAARIVRLKGRTQHTTFEDLRTTIDLVEKILNSGRQKLFVWSDRFLYAYKQHFSYAFVPGSAMTAIDFLIDFLADDPFWYKTASQSVTRNLRNNDTPVGSYFKEAFTLSNGGNAFAFPRITVTGAVGAVTRVVVRNLTNGRTFTYTGTIQNGQSLVIDVGLFSVKNNGTEDLTKWNGSMISLDAGDNSMEVEGDPADYLFEWTDRYF